MAGEIIRQGDSTSHGGKVLEGSMTDICHGKPIAYIGHKVSCPKCGGNSIVEGVLTTTFYGKGVALAGMKTACGATLIATQFTDTVEVGGGAAGGAKASSPARTSAVAAAAAVAAGAVAKGVGAAAATANAKTKKITAISWSYGKDETPVSGVSRFYVDLNLHLETQNYAAGKDVAILIADDEGNDVLTGVKTVDLHATVGADGKAKLMNAFAGKTLITLAQPHSV